MNIKEILKKVAEGKELTAEEKTFLSEYDPDVALGELREKLETLENAGKSDAERAKVAHEKEIAKLQNQVALLTKERDEAKTNFERSERAAKIIKLADTHNFSDANYLDFLMLNKEIDIDDNSATTAFIKELSATSPQLFKSAVKSGGNTSPNIKDNSGTEKRLAELLGKTELSSREAGEVIRLQQELENNEKQPNQTKGE